MTSASAQKRTEAAHRPARTTLPIFIGILASLALLLSACGLFRPGGSGDAVTPTQSDESAEGVGSTDSRDATVQAKPTAIILDASGSMTATDAPGQRFAAAQKAVKALVETIPDGQDTALITYGTETGNADSEKSAGCQDVTTVLKSAPIDKGAFASAVDGLKPSGYTPISLALKTAAAELPDSGERAIVLLSDGIDTCADEGDQLDPCTTAQDLGSDGELTIHTVGFRVDGRTSEQLDCLSRVTKGSSWDAVNDKQLSTRLAMAINPELAKSLLSPSGYKGLEPGMTAEEARQEGGFDDDIPASGRVEIVYVDCTLIFVDGVLEAIESDKLSTIDHIKPGDDIAEAEAIYADPKLPTEITDEGAAIYSADPVSGTGFKFYFDGAKSHQPGQDLSGTITKMVVCKCATTNSYSVAAPPVGIFPGCEFQQNCRIYDAAQVQHPTQGALTLVLIDVDGDPTSQLSFGHLYMVDSTGKVMNADGSVAGADEDHGPYDTSGYGDQLSDIFRFMDPVTDRSGDVFFCAPGVEGLLAMNLFIDPDGYFTEERHRIDYDTVDGPNPLDAFTYGDSSWGDIDEDGYYTLVFDDGSSRTTFHRGSDGYVPD
ncbi:vWA domain-containing protein [Brevibacterium spongiae]|uniref:VWA domain-containing protein n=1 Tax=Brevibacterium spongiae TaxID=2909672 RepID=A0ABY5SUH2_9MICO|nr:VWA domain-containing protein [Brevibacterium spongiae]UVI36349.1 VWA domain-containing protein [Brevibacterium spongiae]